MIFRDLNETHDHFDFLWLRTDPRLQMMGGHIESA